MASSQQGACDAVVVSAGFSGLYALHSLRDGPSVLSNMPVSIEQHVEWITG